MKSFNSLNKNKSKMFDFQKSLMHLHDDIEAFNDNPSQENLDKISSSVDELDKQYGLVKSSILELIKDISDESSDEVLGVDDENGVAT